MTFLSIMRPPKGFGHSIGCKTYAYKKWLSIVILLLSFVPLTSTALTSGDNVNKATATLDLRTIVDQSKASLDGPWQVIRDKIVRPEQFNTQYKGETTMFPDRWHNQKNERAQKNGWSAGFGVASYRLNLLLPENGLPLSLKLQTPYTAHELWINGQLVASNGKVSEQPEGAKAFYLERRVRLPKLTEVSIVLIVSNFEHSAGGILRPPLIELTEAMEREARGYDLSYLFVLGALSALLVFHMAYFFRGYNGGQDWSLFWYCVLVTIVIVRLATLNTILFRVFPDFPEFSDKSLVYFTLYSASAAYLTFLASIFPNEFPRYIRLITYWGSAPFIFSVLFLPVHIFTGLQDTFIIFAMLILLYNQFAIIRAWLRKRSGAGAIVLFTALFLITAINDAIHYLHAFNLRPSSFSDLMPFGFLLLSIGHAIALSARSRTLYQRSLLLADNLQHLNTSLDERVQKRTAEATEARIAAEKSAVEKTNFMSAASHDLRQPVQALSIFNQNLKKSVHENKDLSLIANKQQQLIGSLSDMLETMLEASRLEAKTLNVTMSAVSIDAIFEEIKDTLQPIAAQYSVDLRVIPSSRYIWADAKYLRRVLGNLIDNAIKASPHGRVLLGAKQCGNTIKLIVADNGHGISAADTTSIFDRYVQLDVSKKVGQNGLGLGLSIVQELCALMEMNLEFESEPNRGTIFLVSALSVAPPISAVISTDQISKPTTSTGRRLVILVVDDSQDAREALVEMFRGWGHAARGVSSLETAIDTLDDLGQPDLIVTDYYLAPKTTGLDVISAIEKRFTNTPAIIITGSTAPNDLKALEKCGIPYFHKPVTPETIQLALKNF